MKHDQHAQIAQIKKKGECGRIDKTRGDEHMD